MHITDIARFEDTSASLQPVNVLRIAPDETRSNHESGAVRCHFCAIQDRGEPPNRLLTRLVLALVQAVLGNGRRPKRFLSRFQPEYEPGSSAEAVRYLQLQQGSIGWERGLAATLEMRLEPLQSSGTEDCFGVDSRDTIDTGNWVEIPRFSSAYSLNSGPERDPASTRFWDLIKPFLRTEIYGY